MLGWYSHRHQYRESDDEQTLNAGEQVRIIISWKGQGTLKIFESEKGRGLRENGVEYPGGILHHFAIFAAHTTNVYMGKF